MLFLISLYLSYLFFFFFNDTATTEIYTLSLHDALPISLSQARYQTFLLLLNTVKRSQFHRSEEHTSELQSLLDLVCRLLLEKKKKTKSKNHDAIEKCMSAVAQSHTQHV